MFSRPYGRLFIFHQPLGPSDYLIKPHKSCGKKNNRGFNILSGQNRCILNSEAISMVHFARRSKSELQICEGYLKKIGVLIP